MKTWKIPVYWTVTAVAEIKADTLAEAIDIAKYNEEIIILKKVGKQMMSAEKSISVIFITMDRRTTNE